MAKRFDGLDDSEKLHMQSQSSFGEWSFNVTARNQDDHVKYIAFLMDKSGTCSLSPARWSASRSTTLVASRQANMIACVHRLDLVPDKA